MGEHPAGMRDQQRQQPELDRGQVHRRPPRAPRGGRGRPHVAEVDTGSSVCRGATLRAAARAHARQQLADAERLGQVVVGAGVERRDLVVLAAARRQHDDRHRRPLAQVADEVDAVAVGQSEVEQHQVGRARAGVDQAALLRLGLDALRSRRPRSAARRKRRISARPRRPGRVRRSIAQVASACVVGRRPGRRLRRLAERQREQRSARRRPGGSRPRSCRRAPRRSRGRSRGRARRPASRPLRRA